MMILLFENMIGIADKHAFPTIQAYLALINGGYSDQPVRVIPYRLPLAGAAFS
jgi:hypothetical protein